VKPKHVAAFLGRKLTGNYQGELGNDFHTRIQGTCIRQHMRQAAVKLYGKFGLLARAECVVNDVTFFKHYRKVEHRDGTSEMKFAPVRKSIYSLPTLRKLMAAANRRYLDFIAAIDDPTAGVKSLDKISRPVRDANRSHRGFNLLHGDDLTLFRAMVRGEFTINGLRNRAPRALLPGKTAAQISRMLKRLRTHGPIKKVRHAHKYYLTALGRRVAALALKLREMVVIPSLTPALIQ